MRGAGMRRGARAVALATAAAALALGGCSLGDTVAGVHSVPSERTGGAPLNEETAQSIATGVVADASAAMATSGAAGVEARRKALTGSALSVANAMTTSRQVPTRTDPLSEPVTPQVLGIVRTTGWPRTIVTTTLDEATSTRSLQVMISASATSPYLLSASVTMLAGASVPSLGPVEDGVPAVTDGKGIVVSPDAALDQLARAVAYPKPTTPRNLETTDAFTTGLRNAAAGQAKDLGKLGSFTQQHVVEDRLTSAYRLADGSAVVFGQLRRVDTITPSKSAKQLTLAPDVARALGHATTTKKVTLTYVEPVVVVVPTSGRARVVGADEQLAKAEES